MFNFILSGVFHDDRIAIGSKSGIGWCTEFGINHFENTTRNQVILMGFNTWNSMAIKVIPQRVIIVVTSRWQVLSAANPNSESLTFVPNLDAAVAKFRETRAGELFVVGGYRIFREICDTRGSEIRRIYFEQIRFPESSSFMIKSDDYFLSKGLLQGARIMLKTEFRDSRNANDPKRETISSRLIVYQL